MSTSILMASSDHTTNLIFPEDVNHHHTHLDQTTMAKTNCDIHQTPRQTGGGARRKSSRGNESKKKQPQRGMGVARLERLMLGERFKKLTEINPPISLPPNYAVIPTSFPHHDDPTSLNSSFPLHLAKFGGFPLNLNVQPAAMLVQRVGNNNNNIPIGLFQGQQGSVSEDKFLGNNLYGVVSETSKELSSTPNAIKCYPDHCTVCHLKKRNFSGENLVFKGSMRDKNGEIMPSITSPDFVGLKFGNGQNYKGKIDQDFGKKATFHAGTFSVGNTDLQGGVDVAGVHRKGSERVLMEYEFFPCGKVDRIGSQEFDENELMMKKKMGSSESSSSVAAAPVIMDGDGDDASCVDASNNSVDLSLRLSY